jgi:hypothetical protein
MPFSTVRSPGIGGFTAIPAQLSAKPGHVNRFPGRGTAANRPMQMAEANPKKGDRDRAGLHQSGWHRFNASTP